MSEKSHVGLADCFFCGEAKEVLLDRRLRATLSHRAVYDKVPCDKCKELMKQGVILISVRDGESNENPYRTGGWVVVTDAAIRRVFEGAELVKSILEHRVAFVEDKAWIQAGLPYGGKYPSDPGYGETV